MIPLASQAILHARSSGADEVEAYCVTDRSVSINTKLEHIEYARESLARGIGIRAIVSGAVGLPYVSTTIRIWHYRSKKLFTSLIGVICVNQWQIKLLATD